MGGWLMGGDETDDEGVWGWWRYLWWWGDKGGVGLESYVHIIMGVAGEIGMTTCGEYQVGRKGCQNEKKRTRKA